MDGRRHAAAYGVVWRLLAGILVACSAASLPLLLVLVMLANDPPVGPIQLLQLVAVFAALPALGAHGIRRTFRADVSPQERTLVIRRRDVLTEIPLSAIARITPWLVPLPGPGLTIWLRSGKRVRDVVQLADPAPLLGQLAAGGAPVAAASTHPTLAYAHAAAAGRPWRWQHYAAKFPGFALLPTAVLFNAHQHIAYGGTLGEYYLLGLGAYLRTFAVYWAVLVLYLVLYAGTWRCAAELAAWAATRAAPSRAARVRRVVDVACGLLYYGGVPALVAARFLI